MKIRFTKNGFRLSSTKPGDGAKLLNFIKELTKPTCQACKGDGRCHGTCGDCHGKCHSCFGSGTVAPGDPR